MLKDICISLTVSLFSVKDTRTIFCLTERTLSLKDTRLFFNRAYFIIERYPSFLYKVGTFSMKDFRYPSFLLTVCIETPVPTLVFPGLSLALQL